MISIWLKISTLHVHFWLSWFFARTSSEEVVWDVLFGSKIKNTTSPLILWSINSREEVGLSWEISFGDYCQIWIVFYWYLNEWSKVNRPRWFQWCYLFGLTVLTCGHIENSFLKTMAPLLRTWYWNFWHDGIYEPLMIICTKSQILTIGSIGYYPR